eukprot:jgi/Botrbrau1/7426/Bobra.0112s0025.1
MRARQRSWPPRFSSGGRVLGLVLSRCCNGGRSSRKHTWRGEDMLRPATCPTSGGHPGAGGSHDSGCSAARRGHCC